MEVAEAGDAVVGVKMKKIILVAFLVFVILIAFTAINMKKENFEQKRERILNELSGAINEARLQGKYKCCIEPPCTMCYLGNWIWEDGTCHCDEMIAKGEIDKVCPQCKKGIGEGKCTSTETNNKCEALKIK